MPFFYIVNEFSTISNENLFQKAMIYLNMQYFSISMYKIKVTHILLQMQSPYLIYTAGLYKFHMEKYSFVDPYIVNIKEFLY